jgi:predicted TIM-barrel fold metal-dependent hydrolase
MISSRYILCALLALSLMPAAAAGDRDTEAFADIHVHFNWDQRELIDAAAIVDKLQRGGVEFTVVSGTPSELALELRRAGGDRVVPLFSPYTHEFGKQDWYLHPRTVELAEEGLRSGRYRGIGEVHFMLGFRPRFDNPVFERLLDLAEEYRVPVLVHIDAANEQPFVDICRARPRLKLLVAHAGGNLQAEHVRRLVEQCDNAMIEFSARDPWRYGGLTGEDGRLLPGWRQLVIDYPRRFMTGTDPVWKVTRTQSWDQADDGWDYFEQLLAYHRRWIDDLPRPVAERVRIGNARRFFERQGPSVGE